MSYPVMVGTYTCHATLASCDLISKGAGTKLIIEVPASGTPSTISNVAYYVSVEKDGTFLPLRAAANDADISQDLDAGKRYTSPDLLDPWPFVKLVATTANGDLKIATAMKA